ncbi:MULTISPECIES: hypothetical protein [unclassified Crossiella]|uniref:hypothetical protein n=1 Tax=unclassified Crossiella TaxID=2620835 RepID=UPI001FFF8699|nr:MULTISPECIES: hypothetical protein [unclassified Crossiella]MCK2239376.1 hypothetical protein [Crossiella sp. S99.2]MCK2252071.1 hypothetical protein [Crossiella sp. S99.1]
MSTPLSPVDELRIRYTKSERHPQGESVREIERRNGLAGGALSNARRRTRDGKLPSLAALERWAEALPAPLPEVSRAFAQECGVDLAATLSAEEEQIVADYRALSASERALIRDLLSLSADRVRAARVEPGAAGRESVYTEVPSSR